MSAKEDILDFSNKKKKKPKVTETVVSTVTETEETQDALEFGAKKKKKTKPLLLEGDTVAETNIEMVNNIAKVEIEKTGAGVDELTDQLADELSFASKKKKKKPKTIDLESRDVLESSETADTLVKESADTSFFTYDMLLARVFSQLNALNPELASDQKKRLTMVPPQMARIGTKKTLFVNYAMICRSLNRDSIHLTTYVLAELGTQGSVDANGALLIRGRYQSKHMELVLRNYCRNYVLCGTCQSSETELCKDSRLLFLNCRRCGSRITVKNVTSGFQAVTGKRAALRAKTQ